MPIQFSCACGRQLQASDEHAGRRTRCPACGQEMTIPGNAAGIQRPEPREVSRARPDHREAIAQEPARGERRPTWSAEDEDDWQGPPRTSGKAIASLVLGLLSFLLCLLTGIPALILGISGLAEINRSRNRVKGRGLAITGIILGSIGIFLVIPYLIGSVVYSTSKVRLAANRMQSANNLKQLALGTIDDADNHSGRMVPSVVYDKSGKPLYSWRVLILPYVEQQLLFNQFKLDEPWDSPTNLPLVKQMPKVFALPSKDADAAAGLTYYQVVDGPGAAFDSSYVNPAQLIPYQVGNARGLVVTVYRGPQVISFPASFADSTSQTFLIVEARDPVPWTSPRDLSYGPDKPLPQFGDPKQDGFNAAMGDMSIKYIPHKTREEILRAYITRAGNEVIPADAP
jgi:hypothetical protein